MNHYTHYFSFAKSNGYLIMSELFFTVKDDAIKFSQLEIPARHRKSDRPPRQTLN